MIRQLGALTHENTDADANTLSLRPEQSRRAGRPEAAAAIFDWKSRVTVVEEEASPATSARKRGLVQTAITGTLAALLYFFLAPRVGQIVGGVAVFLFTSSMLFPLSIYAGIEKFVAWLARWLQIGVTWVLMALIFAFVFTPIGVLFRRGKRDRLLRWLEPEKRSYWNERDEPITPESQKRLY